MYIGSIPFSASNTMKVLITGACGFIGYHLIRKLELLSDFEIHGIDNLNNYYDVNLKKRRLKGLENKNSFFMI